MDVIPERPKAYFRWVIVLCSFINHAGTAGLLLSLSVMYVSWLDEFQEPKGVTSWVLSLACSLHNGFGPVPASLAAQYGFRVVAFAGGLLSFVGLVASAFATSVTQLIITVGLITGIGSNFSYLPSIAIVPLYFDKRRSLATGIATTGVGVGALLLAPFVNYLIETYTWRGALLVLGAISLNMCATGLLFRPVDVRSLVHDDKHREEEDDRESFIVGVETEETLIQEDGGGVIPKVTVELVDPAAIQQENKVVYDKITSFPEVSRSLTQMVLLKSRLGVFDDDDDEDNRMHASLNDLGPRRATGITHGSFPNLTRPQVKGKLSHESLIRSLRNLDASLLASLSGFRVLRDESDTDEMNNKLPCLQTTDPEQQRNQGVVDPKKNRCWAIRLLSYLGKKTHLNVLSDKSFLIFCISNFLTCLSYFTPVVYLVDRAVHQGIDVATGAVLISACGCGSIMGRVSAGLMADSSCCSNRMLMYAIALCSQGIGTVLSCFCGSVALLHGAYAVYFGFHMGIYAVLSPLVTVDLRGRSNIATAYGVVLLFMGLASLIGAPISGWLFDWSRSYELSYIANGLFLVISCVMVIPLICRQRKDQILK